MLRDCGNVKILPLPLKRSWTYTRLVQMISRTLPIEIVGIGSYGDNFFPKGVRFDQNFYDQAVINFDFRWSKFEVPRNQKCENEIFRILGCDSGPYIFLHEDKSREFIIDRKRIDSKLRVVEPVTGLSQFSLFDYRKVLEEASEIHLIESSFAAFAESINLTQKLYAHRYARGHALYDFRHEFVILSLENKVSKVFSNLENFDRDSPFQIQSPSIQSASLDINEDGYNDKFIMNIEFFADSLNLK